MTTILRASIAFLLPMLLGACGTCMRGQQLYCGPNATSCVCIPAKE